jgi:hypothetical protein
VAAETRRRRGDAPDPRDVGRPRGAEIVDHYAELIVRLEQPPVLLGNSPRTGNVTGSNDVIDGGLVKTM